MKKIKLIILLLIGAVLNMTAQNWDYLNYPSNQTYTISSGSVIDQNDNIYQLEKDPNSNVYRISKYLNGLIVSSKNIPSGYFAPESTYNHICIDGSHIYIASRHGLIYKLDLALTSVVLFKNITSTNGDARINGISVKNNELFIVGKSLFNWGASSTTINFGTGVSTWMHTSSSNFIVKYSTSSSNAIWMKEINTQIGNGSAEDIAIDDNNNAYITGKFSTALSLKNSAGIVYNFNNTSEHSYLFRINTNSGGYDNIWGFKQQFAGGNQHDTYDVKTDNTDAYFITENRLHKYNATSGNKTYTRTILRADGDKCAILQMGLNDCDEIYLTGKTGGDIVRAICGQTFFAAGMDKNSTAICNWVSNSTSCISQGTSVLIDSNDKVNFTGSFWSNASGLQYLQVDANTSSTTYQGLFLGRINDDANNSCCHAIPLTLNDMTSPCGVSPPPHLYISAQLGTGANAPDSIKWYFNGSFTGVTSPVQFLVGLYGSTAQAGVYSVEVYYPNCDDPVTASMTYTIEDCDSECEIDPTFDIKEENCKFDFINNTSFGGGTTIIGYFWDFGDGHTSTQYQTSHTYQSVGNYIITLTVYGYNIEGECCNKSYSQDINIHEDCVPEDCKTWAQFGFKLVNGSVLSTNNGSYTLGASTIIGYKWEVNGMIISHDRDLVYTLDPGMANICLTVYAVDQNGNCCEETYCEEIEVEEGMTEGLKSNFSEKSIFSKETQLSKLEIFPNPVQDIIEVHTNITDVISSNMDLKIINQLGQVVYSLENINKQRSNLKFDVSNHQNGIYFVHLVANGAIVGTEKFVINK